MRLHLRCFALLLALATPALADRVHLRNGRVVEGQVREEGDVVIVRTSGGIEARLPRDQVARIEVAASPEERVDERLAALDPQDLAGHLALARACDAERLERAGRRVRERILVAWPDDAETRRALGFVRHEGRWMTRAEYMAGLGLVPSDGGRTWVPPEEAARREELERAAARAPELRRLLARAAQDDAVAAVRSELLAVDDLAAVPVLEDHVRDDALPVRVLAMGELARRKVTSARPRLAEAAVEDPRRAGREAALAALAALPPEPAVSAFFVRALRREHVFHRVHAVEALAAFPGPRAVPALITVLRESTAGFGRCHVSVLTQRAYIQDFELTSGGTGTTVAEVADPVIGTMTEGIGLDTRVIQWERTAVLRSLRRITGESFDAPDAWERWWREQLRD